jgi:endonuclease/exonuclease/phosphatase family metal-dependent hydrolase
LLSLTPRRAALNALAVIAALLVPPAAQAATAKPDLTVMSRNLYLGADIITLATAPDAPTEMQKVRQLHETVNKTNFAVRARAIAKEIATTRPDVVGLQEVARYYRGRSGVHDSVRNASIPIYDWVALLERQLKSRHLSYRVVSQQTELDVEVPSAEGYDLRLKLGNAVIVRSDRAARVKSLRGLRGTFKDQLSVKLPDQTIHLRRGYAGMAGVVAGRRFTFLDPHAEAYSADLAEKQFKELLGTAARSRTTPTIMAGDFNSDPREKGPSGYKAVIAAGFTDVSRRAGTCCQDELLTNPTSKLKTWIDHIVVRPAARVLRARLVGNRSSERIGGLWPSDHAGVVATIRLR